MKVTTQLHAYLQPHSTLTPQQMQTPEGVKELSYFSGESQYFAERGYTLIGVAEVTLDVPDMKTLVENKVSTLREQATAIRAEATAKCTEIEGLIQNLLAIEYTPATDEAAGAEA